MDQIPDKFSGKGAALPLEIAEISRLNALNNKICFTRPDLITELRKKYPDLKDERPPNGNEQGISFGIIEAERDKSWIITMNKNGERRTDLENLGKKPGKIASIRFNTEKDIGKQIIEWNY